MYVKPIKSRVVPDPDRGDLLPEDGREVIDQQYWLRRLAEGDVEEVAAAIPATNQEEA